MRPFKTSGLEALLRSCPDALLVPLTINNTYKFTEKGKFPLALGVKVSYYVHPPLENKGDHLALIATAEDAVRSKLQGQDSPICPLASLSLKAAVVTAWA